MGSSVSPRSESLRLGLDPIRNPFTGVWTAQGPYSAVGRTGDWTDASVVQQSTSAPGPAGCAVVDEFEECPPTGAQVHRTAGALSLRRGGSRSSVSELQERLLRLLDTHRVMTTAQLMEITASPERTTEYRMAALAKRGWWAGYGHHADGGRIRGIGG